MGRAPLRRQRAGRHGALERDPHPHRPAAHRCRPAEEEPARRLHPRPQLVQGTRLMRTLPLATLLLACTSLGACSAWKPPEITYDNTPKQAVQQPDPPKPVQIVEVPKPLPLPDQLKPIPDAKTLVQEPVDPRIRIAEANGAARMQPT